MKKIIVGLLLFFPFLQLNAQKTFRYEDFLTLVMNNHPLAKQANLHVQFGEQAVLKAKGGFDPKLYHQFDHKNLQNNTYYSLNNAGLKIPTWYGIEVKTGFESNRGIFLNPEEKTPTSGLWYGGVAVNLGKGLVIDERRAELFKAKLYQQSTIYEQKLQLNELLYEAGYSYWNWFHAHQSLTVLNDAYNIALERLNAIKRSVELGDRSAIDTVEAWIQVQNRLSMLKNFEATTRTTESKLSSFLWSEKLEPLEIDTLTTPITMDDVTIEKPNYLAESDEHAIIENHPYIQIKNFKIDQLDIEKRLKQEMLKPQLTLHYNILNEPINYNPWNTVSVNNYKMGIGLEMPLFLRKERGDLHLSKLKIQDERLALENNKVTLVTKINVAKIEVENSLMQIEINKKIISDSKLLLDAEKQLFNTGESSLFLINSREITFIQAKLKLIEEIVKYNQSVLSLKFALAILA
jgi:outer membrane protein TolC